MRRFRLTLLAFASLVALSGTAAAQQTNEDRLREALKRQTADMRALQDAQAGLQAQISDLTKQRDALAQEVEQLKKQLAAKPAPAQAAQSPQAPAIDEEAFNKLKAELDAARRQNTELQAALIKWQTAYKEAAALAQAKDAEAKRLDAALKITSSTLDTCKATNAKLIGTAKSILHLYETQGFRSLLLKSYEPLVGLARVDLENMVQDYEDKIADGKFRAGAALKASP